MRYNQHIDQLAGIHMSRSTRYEGPNRNGDDDTFVIVYCRCVRQEGPWFDSLAIPAVDDTLRAIG